MPVTPLHMGAGLAIKALTGRHFSVLAFGVAQVAMDIEPLFGMILDTDVLHGPTHTYLGAFIIAVLVAAVAPTICRPILRRWNSELSFYSLDWLLTPELFARMPVIAGAFAGTFSHVFLDSIMHGDIAPLAPWSGSNGLQGLISIEALHLSCLAAGLLGIFGWVALKWRGRRADQED